MDRNVQGELNYFNTLKKKATKSFFACIIFSLPSTLQFNSVAQSCPTLCDPMNHSTPGLPVHHQLLEFTPNWVNNYLLSLSMSFPFRKQSLQGCVRNKTVALNKWQTKKSKNLNVLGIHMFYIQTHLFVPCPHLIMHKRRCTPHAAEPVPP